MSTEPSPERTGVPPRRGPSVDLDPTGIVSGKAPDRQRRQFLNYSFYRVDPQLRRLPAADQREAAAGFVELVRTWESSDDLILRTYSLVGLRADVDFMLWRIAFDPLSFQTMEAAIRRSRLGAYLLQVHSFLSLQRRSEYVNGAFDRSGVQAPDLALAIRVGVESAHPYWRKPCEVWTSADRPRWTWRTFDVTTETFACDRR
jgi:hypothetical protein